MSTLVLIPASCAALGNIKKIQLKMNSIVSFIIVIDPDELKCCLWVRPMWFERSFENISLGRCICFWRSTARGPNYDDNYIVIRQLVLNSAIRQDLPERHIFQSLYLTYYNPISGEKICRNKFKNLNVNSLLGNMTSLDFRKQRLASEVQNCLKITFVSLYMYLHSFHDYKLFLRQPLLLTKLILVFSEFDW